MLIALAVFAAACRAREPEPIALNEDQCGFCRMTISDARFGGEAVLPTGRVKKFDSVECLLGWVRATPADQRGAIYVIDLQHPGTFVGVENAGFIKGGLIQGPMGGSLLGFQSAAKAEEQRAVLGGTVMNWAQVLADSSKVGP
jgi:copper chaperone NosL